MATGGRVLSLVLVVSVSGLVGCGKSQKSSGLKTDGVIVQVTDRSSQEEVQALFPESKVTVVSRDEYIYKIKDIKIEDVTARMPAAYAEEDVVYNFRDPNYKIASEDPVVEKIKALGCKKPQAGDPVAADVSLANAVDFLAPGTVAVGSKNILLTAVTENGAQAAPQAASVWDPLRELLGMETAAQQASMNANWFVFGPPGSQTATEGNSKNMTVTPDRPGGYDVLLLVHNPATNGCALAEVVLGATQNKKYSGPNGNPSQYSSEKFFHVPLVNGEEAWETTQGEGVVIAIVDSGVNYNHPDLSKNILVNEDEIADNEIDDDNNGYVDDAYGYDFAIGDSYAFDDQSHGTHVAGLAASSVYGIAKKAKILPIKSMLPTGGGTTASIVSGIYYAVKRKADIINLSLGGGGAASPLLLAAVRKAQQEGILIVAAAGNSTKNTDFVQSHLTAFDGTNVLSIAATDESDSLTDYSNFGVKSVDMAAPGGTRERPLNSAHAFLDYGVHIGYPGTSMAAPVAAGAAALVKSVNKSLNAEELKAIMVQTGKSSVALSGKVNSGKVLDAAAAVQAALNLNAPLLGSIAQ